MELTDNFFSVKVADAEFFFKDEGTKAILEHIVKEQELKAEHGEGTIGYRTALVELVLSRVAKVEGVSYEGQPASAEKVREIGLPLSAAYRLANEYIKTIVGFLYSTEKREAEEKNAASQQG